MDLIPVRFVVDDERTVFRPVPGTAGRTKFEAEFVAAVSREAMKSIVTVLQVTGRVTEPRLEGGPNSVECSRSVCLLN